jgi:hypothetical protein
MPGLKKFLQQHYVPSNANDAQLAKDNLKLIKKRAKFKEADPNFTASEAQSELLKQDQEKQDPENISAIKEELRGSLLSIASKLLSSEHTRLHHLSNPEQQLWNSFQKADIYEFLTGEKDCIPEFQYNWISPEAPAIRWVIPTVVQPPLPAPPPQPPVAAPVAPPVAPPAAPPQAPPQQQQIAQQVQQEPLPNQQPVPPVQVQAEIVLPEQKVEGSTQV